MKGLSQTEYNILGDIKMFEVESDTNTYNSLYTDVIQRINDIVTDKPASPHLAIICIGVIVSNNSFCS